MRNLFLLLLFANGAYFCWVQWVRAPVNGEDQTVFREQNGAPKLTLLPGGEAANGSTESPAIELAANRLRPCTSVGPFEDNDVGRRELRRLRDDGNDASLRATQGKVFIGHWVQIRNIATRSEGRRMVNALTDAGINDTYLLPNDGAPHEISLGLFNDISGAERIELRVKSLGMNAQINDRHRETTVFWVDLRLRPGLDALQLRERYPEKDVKTDADARCPGVD